MKISILDRVLLTFYTLIVLAVCVFAVLISWRVIPVESSAATLKYITETPVGITIITAAAVVLAILSIKLLFAGAAKKQPKSVLLKTTDNGSIRVAIFAIDELTQRHVRACECVRELKTDIQSANDGIRILLRVSVKQDTVIPEAIEQLQTKTKEYIETYSGVNVKDIHVYVENTSSAVPARAN